MPSRNRLGGPLRACAKKTNFRIQPLLLGDMGRDNGKFALRQRFEKVGRRRFRARMSALTRALVAVRSADGVIWDVVIQRRSSRNRR